MTYVFGDYAVFVFGYWCGSWVEYVVYICCVCCLAGWYLLAVFGWLLFGLCLVFNSVVYSSDLLHLVL